MFKTNKQTNKKHCNSQGPAKSPDGSMLRDLAEATHNCTPGKRPANCRLDCRSSNSYKTWALLDHNSGGSPINPGTQQEKVFQNQSVKTGRSVCSYA